MSEADKLIQRIEQEHRYALNKNAKDSSLVKLLEQPFQPPAMFYEKKQVPAPEKALVMKAHAQGKLRESQVKIL